MRLIYLYIKNFSWRDCAQSFTIWPYDGVEYVMPNPLLAGRSERLIFSYYNENYFRIWRNYLIKSLEWLVTALLDLWYFIIDLSTIFRLACSNPRQTPNFHLAGQQTGTNALAFRQITLEEYYDSIETPLYVVPELVDLVYLINLPSAAIICLMALHYFEHYRPFTITSVRLYFWNCMFILGTNLALIPISYFFPRGYCYDLLSYIVLKILSMGLILWLFWGFPVLFAYHYMRLRKHEEIASRADELSPPSRFRLFLREEENLEYRKTKPPAAPLQVAPNDAEEAKRQLKRHRWGGDTF